MGRRLALLLPLLLLPLGTAGAGSLDLGVANTGLSLGNSPRWHGIRLNVVDEAVERVDGFSFSVWTRFDDPDSVRLESNGILFGLALQPARRIRGLGLSGIGLNCADGVDGVAASLAVIAGGSSRGVLLGPFFAGCERSLHGLVAGGFAGSSEELWGIGLGGLGLAVGERLVGVGVAGGGVSVGRRLEGIAVGGLGVAAIEGWGLGVGGLDANLLEFHGLAVAGVTVRGQEFTGVAVAAHPRPRRVRGLVLGLVNSSEHVGGVQVGLFNRADSLQGIQIGLVNRVCDGASRGRGWMPLLNWRF